MTAILITGMSGTGKSTVMAILRERGIATIETDDPGWCVPENGDWNTPDSEWIWDIDRIRDQLLAHTGTHIVVDGCRPNQGELYPLFGHVVLLTAPMDVMRERVSIRSTNPFGSSAQQRQKITEDKLEFEPLLMRSADHVIDTSLEDPKTIADRLISLLQ